MALGCRGNMAGSKENIPVKVTDMGGPAFGERCLIQPGLAAAVHPHLVLESSTPQSSIRQMDNTSIPTRTQALQDRLHQMNQALQAAVT
jgi:hypothetical protein